MKKFFLFLLIQLLLVQSFFAQEFTVGSGVTEMVASQTYEGNSYVFYVQDELLKAVKYDSAGTIVPIDLFSPEERICKISNLRVFDYNDPVFMCFGTENSIPTFFAFKVKNNSIITSKKILDFNIDNIEQISTRVNIYEKNPDYFFILDEKLFYVSIEDNNQISVNQISKNNEKIINYNYKFDKDGNLCGCYQTDEKTELFYSKNNEITYQELEKGECFVLMDSTDKVFWQYFNGNETELFTYNNNFEKIISKIGKNYYCYEDFSKSSFKKYVKEIDNKYVFVNDGNEILFTGESYPINIDEDGILFFVKENNEWNYFKSDYVNEQKNRIDITENSIFTGFYYSESGNSFVFIDFENCNIYFVDTETFECTNIVSFEKIEINQNETAYISKILDSNFVLEIGNNKLCYQIKDDKAEKVNADLWCYTRKVNGKNNFFVYFDEKIIVK